MKEKSVSARTLDEEEATNSEEARPSLEKKKIASEMNEVREQ